MGKGAPRIGASGIGARWWKMNESDELQLLESNLTCVFQMGKVWYTRSLPDGRSATRPTDNHLPQTQSRILRQYNIYIYAVAESTRSMQRRVV